MAVFDRLKFGKTRYAFILGNGAYGKYGPLENAIRDVEEIAKKFTELGFEVDLHKDLGPNEIRLAFDRFMRKIKRYKKIDTAAIYYAGHAYQEGSRNYILSIPDEDGEVSGFPLNNLVGPLRKLSSHKLLFFDACRNNFNVDAASKSIDKTRAMKGLNESTKISAGLTDARADFGAEVLLSFSAPPGRKAREEATGGSDLSPYATALSRHIDSIDLPLANILGRVHEDVLNATIDSKGNGGQVTWSAGTLSRPYYFKPSSLLFLSGNLMSFLAFFVGLAITLIAFLSFGAAVTTEGVALNRSMFLGSLTVSAMAFAALIYGMSRAYSRMRGSRPDDNLTEIEATANPIHGAVGGLLGGIIGTPLVAVPYWWSWLVSTTDWRIRDANCRDKSWLDPLPAATNPLASEFCPRLPHLMVEIALGGVVISATLGFLVIIFSNRLRYRQNSWTDLLGDHGRLCAGAAIGGTLSGLIVGPLVTAYFGSLDRPFLDPNYIMASAVLCVAIIAFSIVNYSLDRFTKERLKRSFIAAGLATFITAIALAPVLYGLDKIGFIGGILDWAASGYWDQSRSLVVRFGYLILAGVPYGIIFGAFLGFLIGITRVLTEPWDGLKIWPDRNKDL